MNGKSGDFPKTLSDAMDTDRYMTATQPGLPPVPEIPDRYGREGLTLLVRDPLWVFAFWEVVGEHLPPLQLNLYRSDEFGGRNDLVASRPIPPVGRYHLPVPFSDEYYVAAIEGAGEGRPRVTSNVVRTPPGRPSDLEDEAWLTIGALHAWSYRVPGVGSSPGMEAAGRRSWLAPSYGGSPFVTGR